jgi:hypothetical protein
MASLRPTRARNDHERFVRSSTCASTRFESHRRS